MEAYTVHKRTPKHRHTQTHTHTHTCLDTDHHPTGIAQTIWHLQQPVDLA